MNLFGSTTFRGDGYSVAAHIGDVHTQIQFDAELLEDPGRLVGERRREAAQHPLTAVEEHHPGVLGLDAVELVGQCPGGHLPDLAGQLNTGGPTAGDGEGQPGVPVRSGRQGLGHLEGAEQPSPDAHGVVEGFHARRPLGELFVPEVRLPHPDCEDQHVVIQPEGGVVRSAHRDPPRIDVDVTRFPISVVTL